MTDAERLEFLQSWPNKPDPDRIAEIMTGGTLPPCPFCGVPRVERSDYIRCCRCGINWLAEEMSLPNYLNRNPAAVRDDARRGALKSAKAIED